MLNQETIVNLAKLSKLNFASLELGKLETDLNNILNYISQLTEAGASQTNRDGVDTAGYLPKNILRADGPAHLAGEFSAELLAAFPQKSGDYLQVKKVL